MKHIDYSAITQQQDQPSQTIYTDFLGRHTLILKVECSLFILAFATENTSEQMCKWM